MLGLELVGTFVEVIKPYVMLHIRGRMHLILELAWPCCCWHGDYSVHYRPTDGPELDNSHLLEIVSEPATCVTTLLRFFGSTPYLRKRSPHWINAQTPGRNHHTKSDFLEEGKNEGWARFRFGKKHCYTKEFEPSRRARESCVFFSIHDLEVRKIPFAVDFTPGKIDYLDPELKQFGNLKAEGQAELLSSTLGHVCVTMEAPCDRCLESAATPIDADFDLSYRPAEMAASGEEVELDEGEAEMGFYEGDGVELAEVLREFVLLQLPMQIVCRQDCKGICPVCGGNRNVAVCNCRQELADDRWAALKNL
jgi:uncharacterized protein